MHFPDLTLGEMPATCTLDVAADGPHTLDQVGKILNVTRERVRQIEESALNNMRRSQGSDCYGDQERLSENVPRREGGPQ